MNIIILVIAVIIFYLLFKNYKENFISSYNDDPDNINSKINVNSKIDVIVKNFEKLILKNEESLPNTSKMIKNPYYESFKYNIKDTLLNYIKSSLKGSMFEYSNINIIKDPYDIYTIGNGSDIYIFTIDIENRTEFFTETLIFCCKITETNSNETNTIILACKNAQDQKHLLDFTESNNVNYYEDSYGYYKFNDNHCKCSKKILNLI